MNSPLRHERVLDIYTSLKPTMRSVLAAINELTFEAHGEALSKVRSVLATARSDGADAEDEYLNDLFVLESYAEFLDAYGMLWKDIADKHFEKSWNSLQDALDLLRVIKRFSQIDVSFFERQLLQLEETYPYGVFASVGMLVERFDCSICGLDIDSESCPHRRGHLYRGVMASGIARNIASIDHLALTTMPADKRCVIKYSEDGEQFKLVRLLSQLITSAKLRPSDFSHLEHSTRMIANPAPTHLGRNDPCFCGSGKKYKKCCLSRQQIEQRHVDIVGVQRSIEEAVV